METAAFAASTAAQIGLVLEPALVSGREAVVSLLCNVLQQVYAAYPPPAADAPPEVQVRQITLIPSS